MRVSALAAGASLDNLPDDDDDPFGEDHSDEDLDEFPEEFWIQNSNLQEMKRQANNQKFHGTEDGAIGVMHMSPELAEMLRERVKGLGGN